MSHLSKTCINCGQEGTGKFCSNCGQKLEIKAITWKYVASDFMDRWLGMDTKYARTVIGLFKKPGLVIRTYLSGNTIKYIGPLGYYLVMSALQILLFEVLDISIDQFMMSNNEALGLNTTQQSNLQLEFQTTVYQWMARNFRFIGGLMIPFLAISAKLFYRRTTFMHHLITCTYYQSHVSWFSIIAIILYKLIENQFMNWTSFISMIYLSIGFMQFYSPDKKVLGLVKGSLIWIVAFLFIMIIAMVIGSIYFIFSNV